MTSEKIKILKDILGSYRKESSNQFLFSCPHCDHHKQKLSINLEINKFKCWICNLSGNNITYIVGKYGNFVQKQDWLKTTGQVDISEYESLFDHPAPIQEEVKLPDEFICLANKSLSATSIYPIKYLNNRGIYREDIYTWKIGYCSSGKYKKRIIVPSFDMDGELNYFVARTYGGDYIKYVNPKVDKDIVFNELYIDWTKDVILVEGVFDAIKAGPNSIPLLGSTLREDSEIFQKIASNQPSVYIALDRDARHKSLSLLGNLLRYDVKVHILDLGEFEDVGEMTKANFEDSKNNAEMISNDNYLLYQAASL